MKILLIEDDDVFIKVLMRTLTTHHYIVDTVKDGEMGWIYGSTFEYDLIVLDVVLPKLDGISLCKRFRSEGYVTPILLLTAQDSSTAKVQGLDAGADDYVVKPFDPSELIARIRALRRRGSTNPFPLLTCGDLILNPSTCEAAYQGQRLTLTTKEYELLELMMRDSHHVFSTEELLDHLWSSEKFPSDATLRSHIRRVRHKLVAAGAPHDFITTLHGRGYYLKASGTDASALLLPTIIGSDAIGSDAVASESVPNTPLQLKPERPSSTANQETGHTAESSPADKPYLPETQQQYLAFLNETWITTRPNSLDHVATLLQLAHHLTIESLTPQQRTQGHHLAHKLAGTLGIFGLNKAVHLARQLEYWLGSQDAMGPGQAPLMTSLVLALQQIIHNTVWIQASHLPGSQTPLMVLVSSDLAFNQSLESIAISRGIQLEEVPVLDVPSTAGAIATIVETSGQSPSAILLRFPPERSPDGSLPNGSLSLPADQRHWLLQIIQNCVDRYPTLPIVVMGEHSRLSDRLEVVRRGGQLFLDHSMPSEAVMAAVVNLLRGSHLPIKVMIVDDDESWLQTLPTLLKPWGFKVTTLANPHQFWAVLQSVVPDVLVLDVKLPEVNGFELCQILRSDPHWQRLPVLFLSVLTDTASQQHAFKVGADDYLCKPIMGSELAHRILSRLQRVRAWAS